MIGQEPVVTWEAYRKDPEKEAVSCCRQHEQPCEVYQLVVGTMRDAVRWISVGLQEAAAKTIPEFFNDHSAVNTLRLTSSAGTPATFRRRRERIGRRPCMVSLCPRPIIAKCTAEQGCAVRR